MPQGYNNSDGKLTESDVMGTLADYFTGSCVAVHSMGLELQGMQRLSALRFFEARKALGIDGYASRDEALEAMRAALSLTSSEGGE